MKTDRLNNHTLLILLLAFVIIVPWMCVDFLTSVLDAANKKIVSSIHNAVVLPVRVKLTGLDDEQLSLVRVYRVSPRGNRSLYRLNEGVFYKEAKYFADIELEILDSDISDFEKITLETGSREYEVLPENLITADSKSLADSSSVFSLKKTFNLKKSKSFIPQFKGLINYRGDMQMVLLIFLRTAIPVIISLLLFLWWSRFSPVLLFTLSWFVIGIAGFLLSPVYLQIRHLIFTYFLISIRNGFYIVFLYSSLKIITQKKSSLAEIDPDNNNNSIFTFAAVISIFIAAFVLRIWNLNYMQGVDTFNLTSARALNDTGVFSYLRNWDLTYMLAWVFRNFGISLTAARLPFVLISLVIMGLTGLMLRQFGRKALLTGLILYAISPVAIEKASVIREYGENVFLTALICTILLAVYVKYRKRMFTALFWMTIVISFFSIAILIYGPAVRNLTINTSLQASGFLYISLSVMLLWNNYPSLKRIIIAAGLICVITVFVIAPKLGPFSGRFRPSFNFIFFYFNPMVHHPMQWFSFQSIGLVLPLMLPVFALFNRKNRDVIIAVFMTFFGSIALFSVYMGNTIRSRYLYHISPFYIILITLGLIWLWEKISEHELSDKAGKRYKLRGFFIAGCVLIFWLPNTVIAAKHEIPSGQERDVTSFGYRDYFIDFYEYLIASGLRKSDAIVMETHRPDLLCWLLDRPVNNKYVIKRGSYDISENMYLENVYGVKQLETAVEKHDKGYFITRNVAYDRNPVFIKGIKLKYLTTIHNHSFYIWDKKISGSKKS